MNTHPMRMELQAVKIMCCCVHGVRRIWSEFSRRLLHPIRLRPFGVVNQVECVPSSQLVHTYVEMCTSVCVRCIIHALLNNYGLMSLSAIIILVLDLSTTDGCKFEVECKRAQSFLQLKPIPIDFYHWYRFGGKRNVQFYIFTILYLFGHAKTSSWINL